MLSPFIGAGSAFLPRPLVQLSSQIIHKSEATACYDLQNLGRSVRAIYLKISIRPDWYVRYLQLDLDTPHRVFSSSSLPTMISYITYALNIAVVCGAFYLLRRLIRPSTITPLFMIISSY